MIFKYFLNNKAKTKLCYWNYTTFLSSSFLRHIAPKKVFSYKNLVYFSQRPWYFKIFFWNFYSFIISMNLFCIFLIKLSMYYSIVPIFLGRICSSRWHTRRWITYSKWWRWILKGANASPWLSVFPFCLTCCFKFYEDCCSVTCTLRLKMILICLYGSYPVFQAVRNI